MNRFAKAIFLALVIGLVSLAQAAHIDLVVLESKPSPRVQYAMQHLSKAIESADGGVTDRQIVVNKVDGIKSEGFSLDSNPDGSISVHASDDSGLLYGCMELAQRIRESKALPTDLHFTDAPAFKLRGPCIGMQKTYILPG